MNFTLYALADFLSRGINPFFCVLLLLELRGIRFALAFWFRCLLALVVAVALSQLGKAGPVWPGHPGFPSGHTTFAATCATLLYLQHGKRWLPAGVLLTLAMMASLVYGHWHTVEDTLGALVLGIGVPHLVWRLTPGLPPPPRQPGVRG